MKQSKQSKANNNNKANPNFKKGSSNTAGTSRKTRKDVISDQVDKQKGASAKERAMANKGRWYYGNDILANEISAFPFNQFVGRTAESLRGGNTSLPTVMVIPMNPCPGVTWIDDEGHVVPKTGRGINLALQQWWSIITSQTGKNAAWTKNDLGALILEIGEIISITEHFRRFFGLTFNYTLRNRELPKGLLEDMGLDADDFFAHLADYRMKLNTLILKLNKIPIPANISYFEKCQDLYQKVFWDAPSDMAQIYACVPATTWKLREDLVEKGTVLQTTSMYLRCDTDTDHNYQVETKTFEQYLGILNDMIDALMLSSTFTNIYADMLNAAAKGSITLWTFELVDEKYGTEGMFEYNSWFLLMIHNAMFTGQTATPTSRSEYYSEWEPSHGTFYNDVILDVESDALIYNPKFAVTKKTSLNAGDTIKLEPYVVDSITPTPDPEMRIEMNVYKVGAYDDSHYNWKMDYAKEQYIYNMDLPDHYPICALVFGDDGILQLEINNYIMDPITDWTLDWAETAYIMTKFQWAPIYFIADESTSSERTPTRPIGEFNYWTLIDNQWFRRVNDAKYFGLFQIK
jgi:hypothetical protein